MEMLVMTAEQQTQLEALNASGDWRRELQPVLLQDGRHALNADLLADCGPGQTWEHYGPLLGTMAVESIEPPAAMEI